MADKIKVTNRERSIPVKEKLLKILVRLAHLSESLKTLTEEVDKLYDVIGDQAFIDMVKSEQER